MAYGFETGAFFENMAKLAQDFQRNMREQTGGFYGAKDEKNANEFARGADVPANIYKNARGALVFEFALAGFAETDISLSFQGDRMRLSAARADAGDGDARTYLRHDIRLEALDAVRFPVPACEYDQEQVKAVFKNGLLTVTVPRKERDDAQNGVRIEIA